MKNNKKKRRILRPGMKIQVKVGKNYT